MTKKTRLVNTKLHSGFYRRFSKNIGFFKRKKGKRNDPDISGKIGLMSAEELFSQQPTVPEREKQVKIGYSVLLTMDSPVYSVFLHAVNHKFRRGSLRKKYPGLQSIKIVEESKKDTNGITTVEFRAYGVISWGLFRALLLDSLFQGMNNQIFFSNANPVWGSLTELSPD